MHRGNVNQAGRPTCICADPLGCQHPTSKFACRIRSGCEGCGKHLRVLTKQDPETGKVLCNACYDIAIDRYAKEVDGAA